MNLPSERCFSYKGLIHAEAGPLDLPDWELASATGGWRLRDRVWGTEAGGWRLGSRNWGTEAGIRGWRMEAGEQGLGDGGWLWRLGTEAEGGSCGHAHVYSPLAHCSKMVFPLLLTLPS